MYLCMYVMLFHDSCQLTVSLWLYFYVLAIFHHIIFYHLSTCVLTGVSTSSMVVSLCSCYISLHHILSFVYIHTYLQEFLLQNSSDRTLSTTSSRIVSPSTPAEKPSVSLSLSLSLSTCLSVCLSVCSQ